MGTAQTIRGRIFISYRRDETAYPAGWLFDRLAHYFGHDQVFKDVDSIEPGDDFIEVINTAVGSCDVLLALIGSQWLAIADEHGNRRIDDPNDFVRLEIEAALSRHVRVIPILVDGAAIPRQQDLPPSLANLVRHQALELSPSHFSFDTSRLLKVLDKTLAETRAQPSPEDAPAPAPSTATAAVPTEPPQLPDPTTGTDEVERVVRRRVPGPWRLGLAALAALLLLVGGIALRPQPQRLLTVPELANQPVEHVVAALRQLGLTARTSLEANETVPPGRTIRTAPVSGARVRPGAAITLFVSSGPRITPLPSRIRAAREIKVGYVDRFSSSGDDLAPFLSVDSATGHLKGLDYDLARELGRRLQVEFKFTRLQHLTHSFRAIFDGDVDISMSVLRDLTPEPGVDFIDYLRNSTVLLVPKPEADAIRSPGDLCGRTIARPLETPPGSLLTYSDRCASAGRPRIVLMTCPTLPGTQGPEERHVALAECPPGADPLHLLVQGRVSAGIADRPLAEQAMNQTPSIGEHLQVAAVKLNSGPFGIAVRADDKGLRDSLQSALRAIIADGTYNRILSKWGLAALASK